MRTFFSGFCWAVACVASNAAIATRKIRIKALSTPRFERPLLAYSSPQMTALNELIRRMPKAELHMHLEGSIEPDLMFRLARRHGVPLPWKSEADLHAAYRFTNLQSFLDVYYAGLTVLLEERDYFDMARAYMERAHADNVVHAEVFVSPQA